MSNGRYKRHPVTWRVPVGFAEPRGERTGSWLKAVSLRAGAGTAPSGRRVGGLSHVRTPGRRQHTAGHSVKGAGKRAATSAQGADLEVLFIKSQPNIKIIAKARLYNIFGEHIPLISVNHASF